jgi:hypothetical protein
MNPPDFDAHGPAHVRPSLATFDRFASDIKRFCWGIT